MAEVSAAFALFAIVGVLSLAHDLRRMRVTAGVNSQGWRCRCRKIGVTILLGFLGFGQAALLFGVIFGHVHTVTVGQFTSEFALGVSGAWALMARPLAERAEVVCEKCPVHDAHREVLASLATRTPLVVTTSRK